MIWFQNKNGSQEWLVDQEMALTFGKWNANLPLKFVRGLTIQISSSFFTPTIEWKWNFVHSHLVFLRKYQLKLHLGIASSGNC